MTTYAFSGQGSAVANDAFGYVSTKRNINIPNLVSNGGLDATLASTGFGSADILQVFNVPLGFLVQQGGIRVTTVEGATCTVDVGVTTAAQIHTASADTDGILDGVDLNTAATTITGVAYGLGANTLMGYVYVTNGTIDILFNNASTETAVFDIWAVGFMVF